MTPSYPMSFGSEPTKRLRLFQGDTVILKCRDGKRTLLTVMKRKRDGYILRDENRDEQRLWPNEEIFDQYVAGTFEHFRSDLMGLEEAARELLDLQFSALSEKMQRAARFREIFCIEVETRLIGGMKLLDACEDCLEDAFGKAKLDPEIWVFEKKLPKGGRSTPIPLVGPPPQPPFECPSKFAVRDWSKRWFESGRDIRSLIPRFSRCGNRSPRFPDRRWKQNDPNSPLCVYGAMDVIARTVYSQEPRVTKKYAHKKLKELCERIGVPLISYKNFRLYLKRRFNAFEEYRMKHGARAAYYAFRLFERRTDKVGLLDEYEIDHTLIDRVVIDQHGRRCRPWLTLVIDRATRMIVGFHIGFDWPSYATVQRALIHAIGIKDLSGISGLKHGWPCHGTPAFVITDRGLEFLSTSLVNACRDLNIELVNLPGRCPHMKGSVERFFRTLNINVFDIGDGAVKARIESSYDPYANAKLTLVELTEEIVRWIVDEYHVTEHDALGVSPLEKWHELAADQGVTPVGSFERLVQLFGERIKRTIGNTGIEFDYHYYQSKELEDLRSRHGAKDKEWDIRIDPYDIGHLCVLDDEKNRWIEVPAKFQKTTRGFSRYASRCHKMVARAMLPKGAKPTEEILVKAIAKCEKETRKLTNRQAARYYAQGLMPTPIFGDKGMVGSILQGKAIETTPASIVEQPVPTIEPANDRFGFRSVMKKVNARKSQGGQHGRP